MGTTTAEGMKWIYFSPAGNWPMIYGIIHMDYIQDKHTRLFVQMTLIMNKEGLVD